MVVLSKGSKPDNFESHKSQTKLYQYLRSSFEFCWMWIFRWMKLFWRYCSMGKKIGCHNWFWKFLCEGLSFLNLKGLCCTGRISRTLYRFLHTFFTDFTSLVSYSFFHYQSPSCSLCMVFDTVLSIIDKVLSILMEKMKF